MTLFKTTLAMLEEVEAALAALSVPAPGSGTALLVQAQVLRARTTVVLVKDENAVLDFFHMLRM